MSCGTRPELLPAIRVTRRDSREHLLESPVVRTEAGPQRIGYTATTVLDTNADGYVDTDGDAVQETVLTGSYAALFPLDPM